MKKVILSTICIITALASFLLLSSKPEKKIHNALTLFLANDRIGSEELIYDLERECNHFKGAHFKAFLSLAKKDFQASLLYFQQALYQLHKDEEMLDLLLGKSLAFYQIHQVDEMLPLLTIAETIDHKSPQYQLIKSLYYFEKEEYPLFLTFCSESQRGEKKRNWTQGILDTNFSSSWIEIHYAFALIETGQYIEGRSMLEKYIDTNHLSEELSEEAAFYLGYSYLKESQGLEYSEKKSFIKIALFYLEKAGHCFTSHKTLTSYLINDTIAQLKHDEGFAFFSLIRFLEKNQSALAIENAVKALCKADFEQTFSFSLYQLIHHEFAESYFHLCLVNNLISQMQYEIVHDGKKAVVLWRALQAISPNIDQKRMLPAICLIEDKILELIQKENENLEETYFYLTFLKVLNPSIDEMNVLASSILVYGMHYWRKEHEERKGINLLKIALHLTHDDTRTMFEKDVYDFFTALYNQAQQANLVRRLGLIHDAFQELKMNFKIQASRDELANHVADAEFFFNIQDFSSAKQHAGWVMKLEPQNEDAIRFVGLSSFHLGLYSEAFEYLTKLTSHDVQVQEALALCENYFADEAIAQVHINDRLEIDCNN